MRQHAGAPGEPLCTGSCELPPASASTLDKTTRACPLAPMSCSVQVAKLQVEARSRAQAAILDFS